MVLVQKCEVAHISMLLHPKRRTWELWNLQRKEELEQANQREHITVVVHFAQRHAGHNL